MEILDENREVVRRPSRTGIQERIEWRTLKKVVWCKLRATVEKLRTLCQALMLQIDP